MDLTTVALAVSTANGIAALMLTLIRINDRRRVRTRPSTADKRSASGDAGA